MNREELSIKQSAYQRKNASTVAVYQRKYQIDNANSLNAYAAQRRVKARRPAAWSDAELIKDIYALARIYRDLGIDCHVDHMVPLQSKLVSGLHVQGNLTVLLKEDNLRKGNRVWPDMP